MELVIKDFEDAFKQLVFALRLNSYCEQGHLDVLKFDSDDLEIHGHNIMFRAGNFNTQEEVVRCSNINVGICFGALAIQLDETFKLAGIKRDPYSHKPDDEIISLVHMVRCAFAHNMADPKWKAHKAYQRVIRVDLGNKHLSLDMKDLNGREFDYSHIGDLSDWYKICKLSLGIIQKHQSQKAEQSANG